MSDEFFEMLANAFKIRLLNHSSEEAEQLSKMMFSHVIKAINGSLSYKQLQPLWSFEKEHSKEIYTSFCLRADQNVSEIITGRKEQIKRDGELAQRVRSQKENNNGTLKFYWGGYEVGDE